MSIFSINKIYFIVSEDNVNYARDLFQTVKYRCFKKDISNDLFEVNTKFEFKKTITTIENECLKNEIFPYIHFLIKKRHVRTRI